MSGIVQERHKKNEAHNEAIAPTNDKQFCLSAFELKRPYRCILSFLVPASKAINEKIQ